ncbi:hypothetical protein [Undibacterium sp. Tian12W]|uniref:hypothetical protein n=1 Tax=Undibacterium sp. Tian12W TaxID=3413054 RepID=UPI003BF3BE1E
MLKIFVDTEFTDFIDTHLISIGLASASGEEFYAEVPYPEQVCSPFVRMVVIPMLGMMANAACSAEELRSRLLSWLNLVRTRGADIEICFDYQTDWDLFADALDYRVPNWCHPRLVANEINELLRYEFHQKNSLPEHHALYDAQANRYAFRERPSTDS